MQHELNSFTLKSAGELTRQIIRLTGQIEENYPELYKYIEETPSVTRCEDKEPCASDLERYLETLKNLLRHYIEARHAK
jgi:hypothetical protein